MKILILTPVYSERGGGALTMRRMAELMARSGHEVTVVTPEKERPAYVKDAAEVRFLPHRMLFGTEYLSPLDIHSVIKEVRPDIVHGSGPSILCDMGFVVSRLLGIPMVLTYHADLNLEKPLSRIYTRISTSLTLSNLDGVTVTTERYLDILKERGVRPERMAVVPLGCDCARFRRTDPAAGNNILFVGGMGSRSAYKRVDLLIEAFEIVRRTVGDATLTLVGRGDYVDRYRQMVASKGLSDSVRILTDVDDDALPAYYREASVFVLPSPDCQEGFGIVLLEAMAARVPVITSEACGGAPAVRGGGSGLLSVPYDVDDLARKIVQVLTDRALADELGSKGEALAETYDWARSAEKQLLFYRAVLGRKSK